MNRGISATTPEQATPAWLYAARHADLLRDVDVHLARHLLAIADTRADADAFALAVATLSRTQADGNTCLDLTRCANTNPLTEFSGGNPGTRHLPGITAPSFAAWQQALHDSQLVAAPEDIIAAQTGGAPVTWKPLVLDHAGRLYFSKYFAFEQQIAHGLLARAVAAPMADSARIEQVLDEQFGAQADPQQREAARVALTQQLAVITGGPGTGKTTTVTRVLAAMLALTENAAKPLRIHLAAPTGKAAARLGESIRAAKTRLLQACAGDAPDTKRITLIPEDARTLHSLIGTRPDTRRTRHHAGNPLPLDVLVIDEASMIDVPLMARVLAALPPHARLVLLGDSHQLASVEAGAVLGDICHAPDATAAMNSRMAGSVTQLLTSHRFRDDGGIGALARAVKAGDAAAALRVCAQDAAVTLTDNANTPAAGALATAAFATGAFTTRSQDSSNDLINTIVAACRDCLAADDVATAMTRFNQFRVLCALREGTRGVSGLNATIESALENHGLIHPGKRFYRGRPLLITANDYGIGLFNGDVGLVWPDENGSLQACFVAADGSVRRLPVNRLPAHETVYAMTVHKSQGSEFDRIALVLPEQDAPLLTRELVYTAITRARQRVDIYGSRELLAKAVERQVLRSSGLRDALWLP